MSRARDQRRKQRAGWTPLRRVDTDPAFVPNPSLVALRKAAGVEPDDEVWINTLYQVTVRYLKPTTPDQPFGREGMLHLSIHLDSRDPVRNWRHLQQIKNEVAGQHRTAVEIFPPESKLVDTSNEYHLWVLPQGIDLGFGFDGGLVSTDDQVERFNAAREAGLHRGQQEPWEPGLTTGRNEDTPGRSKMFDTHLDDQEAQNAHETDQRRQSVSDLFGEN